MKLLAFAASTSKKSINKQLVMYAASLLEGAEVQVLDLNDYELPMFSVDMEEKLGQPELAKAFLMKIALCDAVIISFAEHNGSFSAAYKSLFDWCSRIDQKVFYDKPLVFISASPGPGGAANVLNTATASAPFFAGNVKATLSIPNFYDNFDFEKGILIGEELNTKLLRALNHLKDMPKS